MCIIPTIFSAVDKTSTRENFAVIASVIDWNSVFLRRCPKLVVTPFLKNGVRPSLIPLLINYFQERSMTVKWHGHVTKSGTINGGGPQGQL